MKRELVSLALSSICVIGAIAITHLTEESEEKKQQVISTKLEDSISIENVVADEYSDYEADVINTTLVPTFKDLFGFEVNRHKDKLNDDYIGAISIPALGTSEPIYRSEGEYYLHRDWKHNKNKVGQVYLDDRSAESLTHNGALLNGHAVPNGSKFGEFKNLLKLEEQPSVYVWDEENQATVHYEIMFVSLIDGNNSGIIMDFESPTDQLLYYQDLHDTAIKKWERPTGYDNFLVLNSCAYIIDNGHYVAFARKVGDYY